jgi:hypothetical protein
MSRLIDQLLAQSPRPAADHNPPDELRAKVLEHLPAQLASTEVFVIDNVADYFERTGGWTRGIKPEDFPNVAPPYQSFLLEYGIRDAHDDDARWGVLVTAMESDGGDGWILALDLYMGTSTGPVGPCDLMYAIVDPSGRVTDVRGPAGADASRTPDLVAGHWHVAAPALLAVSFLHCRNVTTRTVTAPPRINAARIRRGRKPFHRYHTLVIEPMTNILRTEGTVEQAGLAKALHICRGHFKTYEDRPLFGRLHGTWWWQDSVRGSIEAGVVDKDYEVRAPVASPNDVASAARRKRGTIA